MQIGIAAYLRDLADRCNQIGRNTTERNVRAALAAISAELEEKAEVLDKTFRLPKAPDHYQ